MVKHLSFCRTVAPYTGAWIEIGLRKSVHDYAVVAPYTGAWIEILHNLCWLSNLDVAPYTGAWIEIIKLDGSLVQITSHPTRVRGLKFLILILIEIIRCRTLHGCVD